MVDLLIDAGELPHHKPSTVVDLTTENVTVIRQGDMQWVLTRTYISHSPEETIALGKKMMQNIKERHIHHPVVILMKGDLGAGKTILTKGLAQELQINNIISPTYVIAAEYPITTIPGLHVFHHLDLYAIQSDEELQHIGFPHMIHDGNIVCIEWGEKMGDLYKLVEHTSRIYVTFHSVSEHERSIDISYGE